MIDEPLKNLVRFASSVAHEDLAPGVVSAATRRHLDAIGCAAGGLSTTPCQTIRTLASASNNAEGATTFGLNRKTSPEFAVFANSCAIRQLDYNDTYMGKLIGGSHPSDLLPVLIAGVELTKGSGADLILGIHLAYEVFAAFADNVPLRDCGLDQGVNVAISAAAALSRIMGLTESETANAISLALVPNIPLRVVRAGNLSNWKGCATAQAAAAAFWAVRLARAGLTGPEAPFDGVDGLSRIVGRVQYDKVGEPVAGLSAVERAAIKFFPSEMNSQVPVGLTLKIRERVLEQDVESIHVETHHMAWHEIGGGQGDAAEKWDPQTRETADHSLPYLMAIALVDGKLTLDSFEDDRVSDPALRPVMQKITIVPDQELEQRLRRIPQEMVARIRVTEKNGDTFEVSGTYPRGHPMNGMNDDELAEKFSEMANDVLPRPHRERMTELLWGVDALPNLDELVALYGEWSTARRLTTCER